MAGVCLKYSVFKGLYIMDAEEKDETPDELKDLREFSDKALYDFKLIDSANATGDQKAYAELMKRYKKPLYHTILKMVRNVDDAEDLTIEAFAKAFKNLSNFKKDYTFSTWLFKIATNNCIDFIRKKRLEVSSIHASFRDENGENVAIDVKDQNLNPQEEAIKAQKAEIIRIFITKLPPKYQTLVNLRYFQELSYEEIAAHLESPLGTVKAQLHRARELLYDLVKHNKEEI